MPRCKKCGKKLAWNQAYCLKCMGIEALKKAGDESGNPKIWTAKEHNQKFLRSLIPAR